MTRGSAEMPLIGVNMADFDQNGRFVFARGGKLWSAHLGKSTMLEESLLYDFTPLKPERTVAPEWARKW
jgi:hypothetical protein